MLSKYLKVKNEYLQLKERYDRLVMMRGGNYSCSNLPIDVIGKFCVDDPQGKFKTLEDCAFSEECWDKQRELNASLKEEKERMEKERKQPHEIKGFEITDGRTIGGCVKELVEESYEIYRKLLRKGTPITIVCGGQSPSYYCLAMMNFKIFDPNKVNIVILPHSKAGIKSSAYDQYRDDVKYCERLREKGITLNKEVVIIDGVHSGTGIKALSSALKYCYPYINIKTIAINYSIGISKIDVDEEIALPCEPLFSDKYPRLVTSYHPRHFDNPEMFITNFIGVENNPIANMIIQVSSLYPNTKVEHTEWYKFNAIASIEQAKAKAKAKAKAQKEIISFRPIILDNPKRYKCPKCGSTSGTALIITHNHDCLYAFAKPIE